MVEVSIGVIQRTLSCFLKLGLVLLFAGLSESFGSLFYMLYYGQFGESETSVYLSSMYQTGNWNGGRSRLV